MSKLPEPVVRAVRKELDELMRQRAQAVEKFDREIAQLQAYLASSVPELGMPSVASMLTTPSIFVTGVPNLAELYDESPRRLNQLAVEHCKFMLGGGRQLKTAELYAGIVAHGIRLKAEDPERRLVQLLSENKDVFQSDRKNGWSLKGESAVDAALSGASTSVEDGQR